MLTTWRQIFGNLKKINLKENPYLFFKACMKIHTLAFNIPVVVHRLGWHCTDWVSSPTSTQVKEQLTKVNKTQFACLNAYLSTRLSILYLNTTSIHHLLIIRTVNPNNAIFVCAQSLTKYNQPSPVGGCVIF